MASEVLKGYLETRQTLHFVVIKTVSFVTCTSRVGSLSTIGNQIVMTSLGPTWPNSIGKAFRLLLFPPILLATTLEESLLSSGSLSRSVSVMSTKFQVSYPSAASVPLSEYFLHHHPLIHPYPLLRGPRPYCQPQANRTGRGPLLCYSGLLILSMPRP